MEVETVDACMVKGIPKNGEALYLRIKIVVQKE